MVPVSEPESRPSILSRFPFHVALLPFSFAVAVYAQNRFEAEFLPALATTLEMILAGFVFMAVLRPFYRTWRRAGIGATVIIFFMLYGPNLWGAVEKNAVIGILVGLVVVLIFAVLRWADSAPAKVTLALNIVVGLMPINDLWTIGRWLPTDHSDLAAARIVYPDLPVPSPEMAKAAPDIWYIVPDRYASSDVLRDAYGFDNQAFLTHLRGKGFIVEDAHANYQRTAVSLTSVLNLDYLDVFRKYLASLDSHDWRPYYRALEDNRVSRFLDRAGYEIHRFGAHWEPTRRDPYADQHHNVYDLPSFTSRILSATAPGKLAYLTGWGGIDGWYSHCRRLQRQFDDLVTLAGRDTQKYVMAHLLITHPPFVMDKEGRCQTRDEVREKGMTEPYLDSVVVANREFDRLIDAIEAGPRPAIIVLMSDEGPWPANIKIQTSAGFANAEKVDWTQMDGDLLKVKMGVLMAVRAPNATMPISDMPNSPVNVFRWIFRDYFGLDLPPLPERSFIYASDDALYDYIDVTARLPH